jgi:MFS family permease
MSILRAKMSESPSVKRGWLYGGVASVTSATLILELTLTRIFSVTMYYHFAFLAISLALFGLSLAGIYLYLRPKVIEGDRFAGALWRYGLLASISTGVALYLIVQQKVSLQLVSENLRTLTLVYLLSAVPFFFAGLIVTAVVKRLQADMGRIYFFDLAGAAAGCLLLGVLLSLFGGINAVLVVAVVFALSTICFQLSMAKQKGGKLRLGVSALLTLMGIGLVVYNMHKPLIRIPSVKGTTEERVVFSKWNSFSRVTVERAGGDYYWLKMDSSAATRIYSKEFANQGVKVIRRFSDARVAGLVYSLKRPGKALIIGPGGGADVIAALSFGIKDVTGVELNPIIANDVMKGAFKDFNGGLYLRPEVNVLAGEGRSFIRSRDIRYSTIQATLVDTWAATAAGAFTLSENTLYTLDAFRDYLAHLQADGILTMTRWRNDPPREFLRLLVIGRAALDERGIKDHAAHFYVAADRRMATFLLKRKPFTPQEIAALDTYVAHAGLEPIHSPSGRRDNAYTRFLRLADWRGFVAAHEDDLRPPRDDRPFFFYTVKPSSLWRVFHNITRLTEHNLGLLMLLILLGLVLALVLVFFLLPLFLFRRDVLRSDRSGKARYLLYFLALGAGFITVEIALVQKFVLFLGHPSYALLVVLFSLLIFSGWGSYRVRNVASSGLTREIMRSFVVFGVVLVVYLFVLSPLFNLLVGLPISLRVVIAVVFIAPLGLYMGTFLPLGIQGAGERFGELVPWAWGLNGAASVFGSVLAIVLAMNLGFNATLVVGMVFYALGILAVRGVLDTVA